MLGVRSVQAAVEYFCDKLSFERPHTLYGPPNEPVYAIVQRGGISVHLQIRRHAVFSGPREDHEGEAYFFVPDANALYQELVGRGVRIHRAFQDESYGLRDFTIETPDGHRLTFGSELR
jgi:hypothetical protein